MKINRNRPTPDTPNRRTRTAVTRRSLQLLLRIPRQAVGEPINPPVLTWLLFCRPLRLTTPPPFLLFTHDNFFREPSEPEDLAKPAPLGSTGPMQLIRRCPSPMRPKKNTRFMSVQGFRALPQGRISSFSFACPNSDVVKPEIPWRQMQTKLKSLQVGG